jgi:hypothetical protein
MGSTLAATLGDRQTPRPICSGIRSASSTSATAHAPEPEEPAMVARRRQARFAGVNNRIRSVT